MSDSVQPQRRQPTRLPCPWDSPSKNTGVGCHFLLQGMKVKSESEVAQSCPTLSDPTDCSLPGSSDHGIFQARVLELMVRGPLTSTSQLMVLLLLLLSRFSRVRLCATHRLQPTRLLRPWDSPGKNTGVGCHFLLQCVMKNTLMNLDSVLKAETSLCWQRFV